MNYQSFPILISNTKMGSFQPSLKTYLPDPDFRPDQRQPAVVICPGGAYHKRSDREGEPVALRYLSYGIASFVLQYSVAPARYPSSLLELAAAVKIIRDNAENWKINPNRIFISGFSAGGHLAGCLGTMWNQSWISEQLNCQPEDIRPNGMLLYYPLISFVNQPHLPSIHSLLGDILSTEINQQLSLEHRVTSHTPPVFLWHTRTDQTVPVQHSLLFSSSLAEHGVSFELHIYENGIHGLSLADDSVNRTPEHLEPECVDWIQKAIAVIKRH